MKQKVLFKGTYLEKYVREGLMQAQQRSERDFSRGEMLRVHTAAGDVGHLEMGKELSHLLLFDLGPHLVIFRGYSWLSAPGSFLTILEIQTESVAC